MAGSRVLKVAAAGASAFSLVLLFGCASGGGGDFPLASPSTSGTHTVLGRGFFTGGIMVWMDAHSQEGRTWGTVEYSRVRGGGGGETSLRVIMEVACLGVFENGTEAVVTGPVRQVWGDLANTLDRRDWWVVELREGGDEGDLVRAGAHAEDRARRLCVDGMTVTPSLRAVDGDLSIH